jgi:hypothetical protein
MVWATMLLGRSRSAGAPLLLGTATPPVISGAAPAAPPAQMLRRPARRASHSQALIITPRSLRAVAAVVLGVLLAGPLPEAGAFVPMPAALVPAVAFAGSPSCCAPAAARAPRGGWSVAAPSAAGLAARRVGRESTEMSCDSGDGREPTKDGQELAGVWTEEITGDEKFDTAWMAAWQNKDRIPCPFFKRRATDVLEAALAVGRFVLARHKSLLVFAPRSSKGGAKVTGLAPEAVLEVIRSDFEDRRYYITGQLTREVYSDVSFVSVSLSVASGPELAAACGENPAPRSSAGTPVRLHARVASAVCRAVSGSCCARLIARVVAGASVPVWRTDGGACGCRHAFSTRPTPTCR